MWKKEVVILERRSILQWHDFCVWYKWPGRDMSLILMHFYVSPVVRHDAWRNQDEIPQWFPLHCNKASGLWLQTDAFVMPLLIYHLFYVIDYKSVLFICSSILSQSWSSLPCCPFAVAVYLLSTLYFNAFYIYRRHFYSIFAYSYQRYFIFTRGFFIRKMGKCFVVLKLFWQRLVYLTKQCENMSEGFFFNLQ